MKTEAAIQNGLRQLLCEREYRGLYSVVVCYS